MVLEEMLIHPPFHELPLNKYDAVPVDYI